MNIQDFEIWKTGISQAFWCHMNRLDAQSAYEPAIEIIKRKVEGREEEVNMPICWFDKIFRGGIKVPDTSERPLTFLFTGPPGTGKSYLALEMCYMLAKNEIRIGAQEPKSLNRDPKNSIYISTESTSNQIIQRANEFNWKQNDILLKYSRGINKAIKNNDLCKGKVVIFDSEQLSKGENILRMVKNALKFAFPYFKIFVKDLPLQTGIKAGISLGMDMGSKFMGGQADEKRKNTV